MSNLNPKKWDLQTIINIAVIAVVGIWGLVITSQQFALENFSSEIVPIIENYTFITDETYVKYPLSEKISFSSVSPHYLKVEISDVRFTSANIPPVNATLPAKIDFGRPIVKYIDRGVSNQQFDIPFLLTFDAKKLRPSEDNTTLAVYFIATNIKVVDIQNNDNPIYEKTLISGVAIPGKYLSKYTMVRVKD